MNKGASSNQVLILDSFGACLGPRSFAIVDEDHFSYTCGRFVCVQKIQTENDLPSKRALKTFIHGSDYCNRIHSLCASPYSSHLKSIAFAETISLITYS